MTFFRARRRSLVRRWLHLPWLVLYTLRLRGERPPMVLRVPPEVNHGNREKT